MSPRGLLFFLFLVHLYVLTAQDTQFSQYYSNPMFLNPALVGINQQGSAGINYRNQWPSINANFESYSFYSYYNFDDVSSSLGLILNSDREGLAGLYARSVAVQYAYQVRLNYNWTFRPGVEVGYVWKDINFDRLTFGDQFDDTGLISAQTIESFNTGLSVEFMDLAFGGIIFNKQAWLGTSFHHLTEPNQSISGDESPLRIKFSLHGGYKINFSQINPRWASKDGKERSMTPSFNFKDQQDFTQLDVGMSLMLEPLMLGLWYRGFPSEDFSGIGPSDIVLLFGIKIGPTLVGYSYDFTLSNLGVSSGGAHELSMSYSFDLRDVKKPPRGSRDVKCPVPFIF